MPYIARALFPLWYFLKNKAHTNDILFIELPELNLFSKYQIELAKLLILIVNSGINLVISTNSDYIIKEFNNMIMLHQSKMLQKKYSDYPTLDHNNVAAYMLENDTIDACEITNDDGIHVTAFDKIISESTDTNDDIYYSLKEYLENEQR